MCQDVAVLVWVGREHWNNFTERAKEAAWGVCWSVACASPIRREQTPAPELGALLNHLPALRLVMRGGWNIDTWKVCLNPPASVRLDCNRSRLSPVVNDLTYLDSNCAPFLPPRHATAFMPYHGNIWDREERSPAEGSQPVSRWANRNAHVEEG
jgi:hypothetical protein